ncbi:MAG: hypothetical protein AAF998_22805 [Bacteroidota bacterium]
MSSHQLPWEPATSGSGQEFHGYRKEHVEVQQMINASPQVQTAQELQTMADAATGMSSPRAATTETLELTPEELPAVLADPENELRPEQAVELIVAEVAALPIKLGPETHHIELRVIDGEIVVGVASEFQTLTNIRAVLLAAAGEANSEIAGRERDINAIFRPIERAKSELDTCERRYRKAQNQFLAEKRKMEGLKKIPLAYRNLYDVKRNMAKRKSSRLSIKGKVNRLDKNRKRSASVDLTDKVLLKKAFSFKQTRDNLAWVKQKRDSARSLFGNAEATLTHLAKEAVNAYWENFADFLPTRLVPISAVFQDRQFAGDPTQVGTYHTGAIGDPIRIVWYKAPHDYPPIHYNGNTFNYNNRVNIGGETFGVAPANRPAIGGGFVLQKVAHNQTRQNQRRLNQILNDPNHNVGVGNSASPALGNAGGFDGDHVKDLGFGGHDVTDNYWPLAAPINRRAFNGYNANYVVNYKEQDNNGNWVGKSRSIGGLIGKYFRVKGFGNTNVPAESNTPAAGR